MRQRKHCQGECCHIFSLCCNVAKKRKMAEHHLWPPEAAHSFLKLVVHVFGLQPKTCTTSFKTFSAPQARERGREEILHLLNSFIYIFINIISCILGAMCILNLKLHERTDLQIMEICDPSLLFPIMQLLIISLVEEGFLSDAST